MPKIVTNTKFIILYKTLAPEQRETIMEILELIEDHNGSEDDEEETEED